MEDRLQHPLMIMRTAGSTAPRAYPRPLAIYSLLLLGSSSSSATDEETKIDEQEAIDMAESQERYVTVLPHRIDDRRWENDSKMVEFVALGVWFVTLSAFILVNNFVGPWPDVMTHVPERIFFLFHMLGGMFFGGGIIMTAAIERLVAQSKSDAVLQFWFDKVPLLDAIFVLPALTVSMISGTGLSIQRYGGLGYAPPHVVAVFYTLVAFCGWWVATDLATQGMALTAVNEMKPTKERRKGSMTNEAANGIRPAGNNNEEQENDAPNVVELRTISNAVSVLFVFAIYAIMVIKSTGALFTIP